MHEKNALAELAEELNEICYDLTMKQGLLLVIKAQRIIAELAKVRDKLGNPYLDDIENAYKNCRAIAEGEVEDGK